MRFIGDLKFIDSITKDDRATDVMTFAVMTDWFESVKDYMTGMVNAGEYDGLSIEIRVYEHKGNDARTDSFDDDVLIHTHVVFNPFANMCGLECGRINRTNTDRCDQCHQDGYAMNQRVLAWTAEAQDAIDAARGGYLD